MLAVKGQICSTETCPLFLANYGQPTQQYHRNRVGLIAAHLSGNLRVRDRCGGEALVADHPAIRVVTYVRELPPT